MRITYVGAKAGTSLHRASALERLGHNVTIVDPFDYLAPSKWAMRWVFWTGALGARLYAHGAIKADVERSKPKLIWVDHGAFLGPSLIRSFRTTGVPVINYLNDNAWSPIYRVKCRHYRAAIPCYDLITQVRDKGIDAANNAGARHTYLTSMFADEVAHCPRILSEEEKEKYASDVAFVGTWLPERGPFLAELIQRGVPVSIWGNYWNRAPEWNALAPHWRGGALNDAVSYGAAIQAAKICLGLISKQVEDEYTTRSLEIPALGGLLCAERSTKHCEMYTEGEEAVFWDTPEECAVLCHGLLLDPVRRVAIASRGRERALRNGYFNEQGLTKILAEVARVCGPFT